MTDSTICRDVAVFCTVKDEGPFILEWVAWSRLIGFSSIYIAQNDSTDGTIELLECLHDAGIITYLDNSFSTPNGGRPPSFQSRAYRLFLKQAKTANLTWAMALDIDEFLYLLPSNKGVEEVGDLTDESIDEIRLNWRFLSSPTEQHFVDKLVTSRFQMTKELDAIEKNPTPVKTIFRVANAKALGPHFPDAYIRKPRRIINGSGLDMVQSRKVSVTDPGGCSNAFVAHYRTKDLESFLMKGVRGLANINSTERYDQKYWEMANLASAELPVLAEQKVRIENEISKIDLLTAGHAKKLHRNSVQNWNQKIKSLLKNPEFMRLAQEVDPTYRPRSSNF